MRRKNSWNWVKRVGINAGIGDLRREKSWNWVQKSGNDSGIRDLRREKVSLSGWNSGNASGVRDLRREKFLCAAGIGGREEWECLGDQGFKREKGSCAAGIGGISRGKFRVEIPELSPVGMTPRLFPEPHSHRPGRRDGCGKSLFSGFISHPIIPFCLLP